MCFEIEFGGIRKVVPGATPQEAWKAFRKIAPSAESNLARFREIPWNSKYTWDTAEGKYRKGQWRFVEPPWFDSEQAAAAVPAGKSK